MMAAYAGLELGREVGAGKELRALSAQGEWLMPEGGNDNPGTFRILLGQSGLRTEPQDHFHLKMMVAE